MKNTLVAFLLSITFPSGLAAPPPSGTRTINNIPDLPKDSLRKGISRQLYRSLEVSPVDAYLVARAYVYHTSSANAKIIHSEANGIYDKMILEMANGYSVTGGDTTESRAPTETLNVYLLVYKIADGAMGICFSYSDDARYAEYRQFGQAWVGILKNGKWATISKHSKK